MGHSLLCSIVLLVKKLWLKIPFSDHPRRNVSQEAQKRRKFRRKCLGGRSRHQGVYLMLLDNCREQNCRVLTKTLMFHSVIMLSMTKAASGSFVWIRVWDRSAFWFPFNSEFFSVTQTAWRLCYLSSTWHCSKFSPKMPITFRPNLARLVGLPMISDKEEKRTNEDKPFEDLGGIHLTECRHLYYRCSHVGQVA